VTTRKADATLLARLILVVVNAAVNLSEIVRSEFVVRQSIVVAEQSVAVMLCDVPFGCVASVVSSSDTVSLTHSKPYLQK